jgi:hypothetical protein
MNARASGRVAAVAASLALALALISPAGAQYFGAGTLRIVNRGPEPLHVVVNGLELGMALPGATTSFTNIIPGYKLLTLENPQRIIRSSGRFLLRPRGSYTWTVHPVSPPSMIAPAPVPSGAPVPPPAVYPGVAMPPVALPVAAIAPPPGSLGHVGALYVRNRFPVPARVWIGRHFCGRVHGGNMILCPNVPLGMHPVVAQTDHPPYSEIFRATAEVAMGAKVRIDLVPAPVVSAPVLPLAPVMLPPSGR